MESLRLVKSYRTYRSGAAIQATASLAEHLVREGIAVRDRQLPLEVSPEHERAAAPGVAVEARRAKS